MSPTPPRAEVRRQADRQEVVTHTWLQLWVIRALWGMVGIAAAACMVAWRVSAQVSELQADVEDAKAVAPVVAALTAEVRLLRKGQDSLITLMTDRERREAPRNPLTNR